MWSFFSSLETFTILHFLAIFFRRFLKINCEKNRYQNDSIAMITNYTCSNHLNIAKFWRRSVELWRRMTKLVWLSCLMHKFSRSFLNTKLNQRLKINEQTLDFSVIRSLAIKLCIWNKIQSWVWCCDSMLLAEREKTVVIDGEIWFCHCMQIVTFIKHPKCIKYAKLWHCTYWCWIRESSHFYLPFKYCRAQCH